MPEDFLPEAKIPESNGEVMEELNGEPKILDFSSPLEQIGDQSVLCSGTQDLSLSQSSFPHRLDNLTEKQYLYFPRRDESETIL